jgi:hypothetical protein
MICSACGRSYTISQAPGLLCDGCWSNSRRRASSRRSNPQPQPRLVGAYSRGVAQQQCARCGTIFAATSDSDDLCEPCSARWLRQRSRRPRQGQQHPRVELVADREAREPGFTAADIEQLKAALAAEPPEAVTP